MRESDPRRSLHGTEALKAHTWFQQPSQLPHGLARTAWSFELLSGSQLPCLWPAGRSCIFAPEIICSPVPPPASGLLADPWRGAAARRRFAGPAPRRILCQPRHSGPTRRSLNGAPSGDLRIVSVFAEPDVARSYGPVPGVGPIPFVPIDPVVCHASIFVLSRPGCICGRAEARKWIRANLSRVKSQPLKKDIGPPTPPPRGIAPSAFWRRRSKTDGGL